MNTLAGRILLSYVLSYLVGFLLLMVNMKVEVEQGNNECQVMGECTCVTCVLITCVAPGTNVYVTCISL